MDDKKGNLTFSFVSIQGKDRLNNTDKLYGISGEDYAIVTLIDPSTGSPWGENFSSLLAGSITDSIKDLLDKTTDKSDITNFEEEIKNLIKEKVLTSATSLPKTTLTTTKEFSIHLAVIIWLNNKIFTLAAGKTSIYKVENHQLKAVYLLMDKPPIKLDATGKIIKFSISINSFDETETLSSFIVASDGFYQFLKNPKIHNLLERVDSPRSVLAKLEEHIKKHLPDDNATVAIVWREVVPEEELSSTILETLTTSKNIMALKMGVGKTMPEDYKKTYDKSTVEKLTRTLRNIYESDVGREILSKDKKGKKSSKLLTSPKEKRDFSLTFAIIIVILFLLLFGGFIYLKYGSTIANFFGYQQQQQQQDDGQQTPYQEPKTHEEEEEKETTTTTTTQTSTISGASGAETSTTTEVSGEITETPTETATTGTTSAETATTSKPEETTTQNLITFKVTTKPSGLRVSLIQTDNKGNQINILNSCKAPCSLTVDETIENPMFVAMYYGAICASYPKPQGSGWLARDLKTNVILDCRYIAEEDPERPILITTNPSNIRVKIFNQEEKELISFLSPARIPLLGDLTDKIIVRAYIKGKQCAAYKTTWEELLKLEHIHLVCRD